MVWLLGGLATVAVAALIGIWAFVLPRNDAASPNGAVANNLPNAGQQTAPKDQTAKTEKTLTTEPTPKKEQSLTKEQALKQEEEKLKQAVEQHLGKGKGSFNPAGVEACIDLAVLYLDQDRPGEAEALFKRMAGDHKAPSAYHFVGLLGQAVTDAIKEDDAGSKSKFNELYHSKTAKDKRVEILNTYLKKKPQFEQWVAEADVHDLRKSGAPKTSFPKIFKKNPFKKS